MLDTESLRHAVIEALGSHPDPRAVEVVEHARIAVLPAARRWTGSAGAMTAHGIRLDVDARTLAQLHARPAVRDVIVTAFATAIARHPGEALHELDVVWGFESNARERGYRDGAECEVDRDDADSLAGAVITYLEARGEHASAEHVRGASFSIERGRAVTVAVGLPPAQLAWFANTPHAAGALDEALTALLHEPGVARVRVKRR